MKKRITLLTLLALLVMSAAVSAKPVFNFNDGTGYVSKQDILTALDLDKTKYDPSSLSFVATYIVTQTADCRLESLKEVETYSASVEFIVHSTAVLSYGVLLDGYGSSSEPGYLPQAGATCYAANFQGTLGNITNTTRIKTLSVNGEPIYQEFDGE